MMTHQKVKVIENRAAEQNITHLDLTRASDLLCLCMPSSELRIANALEATVCMTRAGTLFSNDRDLLVARGVSVF